MSTPPPLPAFNPYSAPQARIEAAVTGELELADRGIRLAAVIIDSLLFGAIGILAAVMIPALMPTGGGEPDPVLMGIFVTVIGVAFIALLAVNLVLLHRHGQTIAKRWLSIRVVRSDGSHCALLRIIFARWLPVTVLGAIPLVGYAVSLADALFIFREDRRCLHDLIADTIVVRA